MHIHHFAHPGKKFAAAVLDCLLFLVFVVGIRLIKCFFLLGFPCVFKGKKRWASSFGNKAIGKTIYKENHITYLLFT
jgi:hypothetical protein